MIFSLRIGHDNSDSTGWFVDEVNIDIPTRDEHAQFKIGRWLSETKDDKQIEVELYPSAADNQVEFQGILLNLILLNDEELINEVPCHILNNNDKHTPYNLD